MSSYTRPITCEFCHPTYGTKFDSTNRSKHPVRIIQGSLTVADNTFGTNYGTVIDCKACHNGNVTTGSPVDLTLAVSPLSYTNLAGTGPRTGTRTTTTRSRGSTSSRRRGTPRTW